MIIQDDITLIDNAKKVVLLEPMYPRTFIPLGLAKIATYVKSRGGEVVYQRKYRPCGEDLVCITSFFTWYYKEVHDAIRDVMALNFFDENVKIMVGGVYASLMPEHLEKAFPNVYIFRGCSTVIDEYTPDYTIDYLLEDKWKNISNIYTTRGCPNNCKYCTVQKLEPKLRIIKNWKEHIDPTKSEVMISDANLSAQNIDHIRNVLNYLIDSKKKICFRNGFDCKYISDEVAALLGKIKFASSGMRLAFDRIEEDGVFQSSVKKLMANGVSKNHFFIYVLFNFTDTPAEAVYRMSECIKLGIHPYPSMYTRLNRLDKKEKYLGKHWTPHLRDAFRFFYLFAGYYKKMSFYDWCKNTGSNCNKYTFTEDELNAIKIQ
jgi:hypothetical protein